MEQIGAAYVGKTSDSQLIASVSIIECIAATIVGNAAASYTKGLALRNGASGLKVAYTNAVVINDEAVGTGDGSTTTFDLAHANVIAASIKGYSAGNSKNVSISAGTGAAGVDQLVFAVAPTNAEAIKADYSYYGNAIGAVGACVLAIDVTTTVVGGNMTVNGIIAGNLKSSLVLDSAGVAVDQYFKDALPKLRLE